MMSFSIDLFIYVFIYFIIKPSSEFPSRQLKSRRKVQMLPQRSGPDLRLWPIRALKGLVRSPSSKIEGNHVSVCVLSDCSAVPLRVVRGLCARLFKKKFFFFATK